jgi:hypothetical protein
MLWYVFEIPMALPGVFPYVCVCRTACFETYKHEHLLESDIFITVPYPVLTNLCPQGLCTRSQLLKSL